MLKNTWLVTGLFLLWIFAVTGVAAEVSAIPANQAADSETSNQTSAVDREQVRQVLLEILQADSQPQSTATPSPSGDYSYDETTLNQWEATEANKIITRLQEMRQKLPGMWEDLTAAFALSTSPAEGFGGWWIVITILMHLALGLVLEYLVTRPLLKRLFHYADSQKKNLTLKVKFITTRLLIQMLGLVVLALSTYGCALFFIKQNPYFDLLFFATLKAFIFFRFFTLIAQSILSPFSAPLRLLTLRDETAKRMYYWVVFFFGYYFTEIIILRYLPGAGVEKIVVDALLIPMSIGSNAIILTMVWSMRKRITAMFVDEDSVAHQNSFASRFFVQSWPYFFTAWLILIWMLWQYRNLQNMPDLADGVGVAWVITKRVRKAPSFRWGI